MNKQIEDENKLVSGIFNQRQLIENLKSNCVPESIMIMKIEDYQDFLIQRRKLIAEKNKNYYFTL